MLIYTYTCTQVLMNKIKLKPTCQQQVSRVKGPSRRDARCSGMVAGPSPATQHRHGQAMLESS